MNQIKEEHEKLRSKEVIVPEIRLDATNLENFELKENGPFNRMELFSRAGEIPGPPSVPPEGSAVNPSDNTGIPNRPYTDSVINIGNDARSEFGGTRPGESLPDLNIYQNKKTVAQGMMDLALFSANANQLRYVMESNEHPYFLPGVILISFSLILQVAVGVGLLLNTRYNVDDKKEICIANKINNFTIVGIFLVTVINVFISAFGVASGTTPSPIAIFPRFGNETDSDDLMRLANGTIIFNDL